jgi:hypothetical protein
MRNFPRIFKLAVLAAIVGIVVVLGFQACVTTPVKFNRQFGLEINQTFHLVDLVGFIKALNTLSKSAVYDFRILRDDAKTEEFRSGSMLNIKTDKVTMFATPTNTAAEKLTPIGSHVTQRIHSNSVNDIQIVLDQLKKQEP